jgi:hypothetical protein
MKTLLLLLYFLYPPDTLNHEQQPLTAIFTDAIKKNNILYLQFTDGQKKIWLFNAIKSETVPYVFYTTEPNGNIIINPAIRNHRFSIRYKKVVSGGRKENWIISLKELTP